MTPTSVGMRCPECSREKTKVRSLRTPATTRSVTDVLIAINVIVFLAEVATGVTLGGTDTGWVYAHGSLLGPALTAHNPYPAPYNGTHEYWRLLTAGFLHASLIHIGLNMLMLWFIGRQLEPAIGKLNFTGIYFASLLAGSFGSLLFEPAVPSLGASTAIFGLLGALIVLANARGISIWQSGLGPTLLINLMFTLTVSNISIGGHLGGLLGGLLSGWFVVEYHGKQRKQSLALAGCAAVAVVSIIAAVAVAGGHGLTPNGITI